LHDDESVWDLLNQGFTAETRHPLKFGGIEVPKVQKQYRIIFRNDLAADLVQRAVDLRSSFWKELPTGTRGDTNSIVFSGREKGSIFGGLST